MAAPLKPFFCLVDERVGGIPYGTIFRHPGGVHSLFPPLPARALTLDDYYSLPARIIREDDFCRSLQRFVADLPSYPQRCATGLLCPCDCSTKCSTARNLNTLVIRFAEMLDSVTLGSFSIDRVAESFRQPDSPGVLLWFIVCRRGLTTR